MTLFEEFCQARILSAGEWYSTAQPSGAFSRKDAANACGMSFYPGRRNTGFSI